MALQDHGVPTLLLIPLIQLVTVALLFVALLNGQHELAILCLLVLTFVGGIWLWTKASLSGLACRSFVDREKLFPGEKYTFVIRADNRKILPVWLQIMVPFTGLVNPDGEDKKLIQEGGLLWYQRADFTWELTAERRGLYRIGPPHILAGDLFAFFTRRKKCADLHTILVYPRLVPIKAIPLPRRDFFGIPGAKSPVQDPIYLLGTRDYQHGRPAKYIHWKASARRNSLQEKVLEPTQQEKVLLVVDVTQFARRSATEDFEKTLEGVASFAALLDRRGHSLGLVTNGVVDGGGPAIVPIARNNRQLPAILEVLARLHCKTRLRLTDAVQSGITLTWGLSCVCFFYREDGLIGLMDGYFKRGKIPVVFIVSRREQRTAPDSNACGSGRVYALEELAVPTGVQT